MIKIKSIYLLISLPIFCMGLFSCNEDEVSTTVNKTVLLTDLDLVNPYAQLSNHIYSVAAENIANVLVATHNQELLEAVKYDVSVHRILYTTTYKDKEITASGLIAIPLHPKDPPALLSYHHGSLTSQQAIVPSLSDNTNFYSESVLPGILFASHGDIAFIPDYIGYGASSEYLPPFKVYKPTVNAVIDMIKKGKIFLEDNDISFNKKLFLAGFSEGGYVTMAVHKELASQPKHGLNVTTSSSGGGIYHIPYELQWKTAGQQLLSPRKAIYIILSYNYFYWKYPLTNFFTEPLATELLEKINNENYDIEIESSDSRFLNTDFLTELNEKGDNHPIMNMARVNSVDDWIPHVPIQLWHGKQDTSVDFGNTQVAYNSFLKNGTDPELIHFYAMDHVGHDGAMWLKDALNWFDTF